MDTFTDNLLFTKADLEAAHEAINERPLYEAATQRLAKAVRDRNVTDLAALVVDIHNNNRLCVPPTSERTDTEPIIVRTMRTHKVFMMFSPSVFDIPSLFDIVVEACYIVHHENRDIA